MCTAWYVVQNRFNLRLEIRSMPENKIANHKLQWLDCHDPGCDMIRLPNVVGAVYDGLYDLKPSS